MSGSDDDKTGFFKNPKTRVVEKSVQVQMTSGKIYGPYSRDEILAFIENKKIRGEEKILFEGETAWKQIATDSEFFDAIHALISGKQVKRRPVSAASHVDAREATRIGKADGTRTEIMTGRIPDEVLRPADLTREIPMPPPEERPAFIVATSAVAPPPGAKARPKSSLGLAVMLAAILGLGYLYTQKQRGAGSSTDTGSGRVFEPHSAKYYSRPLALALKELRLPNASPIPADVVKSDAVANFVYSLNARKIVMRLNTSWDIKEQPEAKTSGYWVQRSIDLQLLGLRAQVLSLRVGASLIEQGKQIWKTLRARKLVDDRDEKLLVLVTTHSLGDWDAVVKQSSLVAHPAAAWLEEDSVWWNAWLQGQKKSVSAASTDSDLAAELDVIGKIRQAYFTDDPQTATWLLQLASIEPESPYLWYVSAQINWRKGKTVQVQNAYRDFIVGLGSLSLYPPAVQIAYWTQFADFLRSYARSETYARASDNLEFLRGGDISFKDKGAKTWWDIGDDGLNAKDIADEILARSSKGMLNARDRAALEVLGSGLDKGAQYLFVVGAHLAFEEQWTDALHIFDEILERDPRNPDGLFGKIWALCRLFRFSEAQATYESLTKASAGTHTQLRSSALIHFLGREYNEAHRIFNDYLAQSPTDAWAHYFQAQTYLAQERYLDCAKSANLGQLSGKGELQFRAQLLYFTCRVRGGVGIRDSLDGIAKQIRESPDNLPLRLTDIELLNESKLYDDAVRVLEDSLKTFPFSSKLRLAAGDLFERQGVPSKAIEHYLQAAKLDPAIADPWVGIAKVLLKQDKYLEAAKNYQTAARIQPSYPEIYLLAARAYDGAKKVDEAASSYEKEIEARPSAVGTFVEAAEFLLKNNAPQKIPEFYRKFQVGGFEEDPRALLRLALAYNVMGDLENAKTFASRAVNGNPDDPYANMVLANVLDRASEFNLAKRYYESYLKLMPMADDRESLRRKLSQPPYAN